MTSQALAEAILLCPCGTNCPQCQGLASVLTTQQQADYARDERAAILEYDAADVYPTRAAAERRAAQLEARQQATR